MAVTINASTSNGLVQTADTSGNINIQSNGTTIAAVSATGVAVTGTLSATSLPSPTITSPTISGAVMSSMASSVITSGTAVASTSGTSIPFTGIPSWVKRITVMFNGVSTSGSSPTIIQLGSGSITTSGYTGGCMNGVTSGTATSIGWNITANPAAVNTRFGNLTICNISGNIWVISGVTMDNTSNGSLCGGTLTLSGTLDRLNITQINGTDTFDAGSINILYE